MELVNPGLTSSAIPVLNREKIFSIDGTFTPEKSGSYLVYCFGGGGGGGGGAGSSSANGYHGLPGQGGVAGQWSAALVSLISGTAYNITIGSGGAGALSAAYAIETDGSPGGNTSFDILVSASGGAGGYGSIALVSVLVGTQPGCNGTGNGGGQGGAPALAAGNGNPGQDATGSFGAGGGGGSGAFGNTTTNYSGGAGGAGAPGSCIIIW